jgi:hypothetical protein
MKHKRFSDEQIEYECCRTADTTGAETPSP